jgi:hypothetical protein
MNLNWDPLKIIETKRDPFPPSPYDVPNAPKWWNDRFFKNSYPFAEEVIAAVEERARRRQEIENEQSLSQFSPLTEYEDATESEYDEVTASEYDEVTASEYDYVTASEYDDVTATDTEYTEKSLPALPDQPAPTRSWIPMPPIDQENLQVTDLEDIPPSSDIPSRSWRLPQVQLPQIQLPQIQLPQFPQENWTDYLRGNETEESGRYVPPFDNWADYLGGNETEEPRVPESEVQEPPLAPQDTTPAVDSTDIRDDLRAYDRLRFLAAAEEASRFAQGRNFRLENRPIYNPNPPQFEGERNLLTTRPPVRPLVQRHRDDTPTFYIEQNPNDTPTFPTFSIEQNPNATEYSIVPNPSTAPAIDPAEAQAYYRSVLSAPAVNPRATRVAPTRPWYAPATRGGYREYIQRLNRLLEDTGDQFLRDYNPRPRRGELSEPEQESDLMENDTANESIEEDRALLARTMEEYPMQLRDRRNLKRPSWHKDYEFDYRG